MSRAAAAALAFVFAACAAPAREVRDTSGDDARAWHRAGVERHDDAILARAQRAYEQYLGAHPRAPDAGAMRYWYAELLWVRARDAGGWRAAALAYEAALDAGVPDDERAEAAYAALLAWRSALGEPAAAAAPESPRAYTEAEATLVRAARRDLAIDPKRELAVVYFAARLAYGAGHWDDAAPLFEEVVDRAGDRDELAEYAATLLLDTLLRAGREPEMRAWIDRLDARGAFVAAHPGLAATLDDLHVQLARAEAERREASGDARGCAEAYDAILRDHPKASRAEEIAWNEGVCWARAGEREHAERAYRDAIDRAPDSAAAGRARAELSR